MAEKALKTPVAFFIFNRPDTTARVFEEITIAKPPKLLVVADGPRADRSGEEDLVAQTRAIIDKVSWECEVLTNYSDVNMGCKNRLSSGLDWVFENVQESIILEDDCLPDQSFFKYCEDLLDRYRNDNRIGIISGTNLLSHKQKINDNRYHLSKHCLIWGWATWADRWRSYSKTLDGIEISELDSALNTLMDGNRKFKYFWRGIYERARKDKLTTWDFQLSIVSFYNEWMNLVPSVNLIKNIGYGVTGTHTSGKPPPLIEDSKAEKIGFPLKHPVEFIRNVPLDKQIDSYFLPSFHRILVSQIKNLLIRS